MTNRSKQMLTKYFFTVLVLFLFSASLVLVQRFVKPRSETALRLVAQTALESTGEGKLVVGAPVTIVNSGFPGTYAFSVTKSKKLVGIAFVTPIMGNSGPYTGVFYWTSAAGARFCAIAGFGSSDANPERCGISKRVLDACRYRLESIAAKKGENP